MKKSLLIAVITILFTTQACFAGSARIFENTNASILRDQIIKLYTLEGAHVENYINSTNSFSISKNERTSLCNVKILYDYTIVQDKKNTIVSLAMSTGVGGYINEASLSSSELRELDRIKGKILGYYSYGIAYPEKTYFYTEFNENGMLVQKNAIAGSQRILGFKLTAVKYDAKNKGLYIGDRIKKINGIKISKYSIPDLASIFKPISANDELEITYKRQGKLKTIKLKPTFVKTEVQL